MTDQLTDDASPAQEPEADAGDVAITDDILADIPRYTQTIEGKSFSPTSETRDDSEPSENASDS